MRVGERMADQLFAAFPSRRRRGYYLVSTRSQVESKPKEVVGHTVHSSIVAPVHGVLRVTEAYEHYGKDWTNLP